MPRANLYLYISRSEIYRAGRYIVSAGYIALAKRAYHAPSADGAIPSSILLHFLSLCTYKIKSRRDRRPRRSVGIKLYMCVKSRKYDVVFLVLCKAIRSLGSDRRGRRSLRKYFNKELLNISNYIIQCGSGRRGRRPLRLII